jgi:hypothetical protein
MPQLSLYLDEKTLKMVQQAAKLSRISMSKWVAKQLRTQLHNEWPQEYFKLFGSIMDPSFAGPEPMTTTADVPREAL